VKTGTSATAYRFIQLGYYMSVEWNVPVDLELLRLALLAYLIPAGHHTFHEIMRGAALFDPKLRYSDSWGRYWDISPLTVRELRVHVAKDGNLPDEHVWELAGTWGAALDYGDSPIPPPPLTTAAVLALTDSWSADDGTAEVVWLRSEQDYADSDLWKLMRNLQ